MAQVEAKQGGRIVKRWVAECDFHDYSGACEFNARKNPKLHTKAPAAVRESITHAVAAGHVGAREVDVRRKYQLASEEVITP